MQVLGNTLSNGTFVQDHTRSTPSSSRSRESSSSNKVHVRHYTRANGTPVQSYKRAPPSASGRRASSAGSSHSVSVPFQVNVNIVQVRAHAERA